MNSSISRLAQVRSGAQDALHLAFIIEIDDRLRQVEVDGAALLTLQVEDFGKREHAFKLGNERCKLGTRGLVAFKDRMDLRVRHARARSG